MFVSHQELVSTILNACESGDAVHVSEAEEIAYAIEELLERNARRTMERQPVILRRGDETLRGEIWWEYPVDEPSLVEAGGFRLYLFVWRKKGWEVVYDGSE